MTAHLFSDTALAGRTALVTGASRGIGAAIADAMAAAGAQVIGTATSEAGAAAIGERLGERGTGQVLDISSPESVAALISTLKESPPDVLVNNAGITRDNLLMRMKDDEWDAVIATNLSGVFRLTKGLIRGMMKKRFGRIISISSVVGTMGNAGQANYAAAKAGVVGFSKSVARELGSRGITSNVIAPGFIETDMTDALDEAQRDAMLSQVPLESLGRPADIAHCAVYLASDAGAYITGETLHVNGGMIMP
ncbi:MAG: 3-oxoacyl-ACP reductase FabG [Pseudomonadota bacterium]